MKNKIKEIIESYCQGNEYLEFEKSDFDKMVEEIINIEPYYYKEGYIYKGRFTICELYGNDDERLEMGNVICHLLNKLG